MREESRQEGVLVNQKVVPGPYRSTGPERAGSTGEERDLGIDARNDLVERLKALGYYEKGFDQEERPSGRNLLRRPETLSVEEMNQLLKVFEPYLG